MIENGLGRVKIEYNLYHLYHSSLGEVLVEESIGSGDYPIYIRGSGFFAKDGRCNSKDLHPTLFKSIDHLIKYFTEVRDEKENS